ncbi:MAG: DUF4252 domain-containing protein [Bacteroidales bacterium]|nr:DUF4252 domain-containing protein [Bacteroidales bacterium]
MVKRSKLILVFCLLAGMFPSLQAQETPFKAYADAHKDKKFCFYPSTLRMINIAKNPDYNELVNGIEKLLVYTLDSAAKASQSYNNIITSYKKIGFEEYVTMAGGKTNFILYGKENKDENQFVGVMKSEGAMYAFYLRGRIGWQKIPALMQSFQSDDMINIFDLNKQKSGKRPQDK